MRIISHAGYLFVSIGFTMVGNMPMAELVLYMYCMYISAIAAMLFIEPGYRKFTLQQKIKTNRVLIVGILISLILIFVHEMQGRWLVLSIYLLGLTSFRYQNKPQIVKIF